MAALKKEVKLYIVRALAVFNTPQETVELVQQEFGITITRQKCEAYDPTKRTGQNLSQELKEEFEATREQYLANPKAIPIANQTVRLQRYENQYQGTKNPKLRLEILEKAAKEIGGQYTNQSKVDTTSNGNTTGNTVVNNFTDPMAASQFYQEFMGAK